LGDLLTHVVNNGSQVVPPQFTAGEYTSDYSSTEFGWIRYGSNPNGESWKAFNDDTIYNGLDTYDVNGDYNGLTGAILANTIRYDGGVLRLLPPSGTLYDIKKIKFGALSNIESGFIFTHSDTTTWDSTTPFTITPGIETFVDVNSTNTKRVFILVTKIKAGDLNSKFSGVKFVIGDGSRYLKLQFPEGSPTHPSLPAGHACVAGACTTVLKAMLKTHDESNVKLPWPTQAKHSIDGYSLIDTSNSGMTIVGELNKMASNVSLGRNVAGVHTRCDGECGMKLGEQYAITYLVDKCKEYAESENGLFYGFILEKFDGSSVLIRSTGVTSI
jgi:hypothetical protein